MIDNKIKDEKVNLNEVDKLARLLANENLTVEHSGKAITASFDLENRILTLPCWKDLTKPLYHMLIGHETGHALHTTFDEWLPIVKAEKRMQIFLNVVEDARIEKLMKETFPGLRKDFHYGYNVLAERDFFRLKASGKPLEAYSLLDRINLHYKIGSFEKIPFEKEELHFLTKIDAARSFQDVARIARELFEHAKEQGGQGDEEGQQKKKVKIKIKMPGMKGKGKSGPPDRSDSSGATQEQDEESKEGKKGTGRGDDDAEEALDKKKSEKQAAPGAGDQNDGEDQDDQQDGDQDQDQDSGDDQEDGDDGETLEVDLGGDEEDEDEGDEATEVIEVNVDELDSETFRAVEDALKKLVNTSHTGFYYVDLLKSYDYKQNVVPYKKVLDYINSRVPHAISKGEYPKLYKKNIKTINYLVKEFEMRKAAEMYARASTAKTGVLNATRLHQYQLVDDIFKRTTILPKGKNHGIVMFVDFSGSMSGIMSNTVRELFNLAVFCRKVKIPFRVFGFSNASSPQSIFGYGRAKHYGHKTTYAYPGNQSLLIELFNNNMSSRDFTAMMESLLYEFQENGGVRHEVLAYQLGSTPLNCSVIMAHDILADFKEATRTDIVSAVFLTDGDSDGMMVQNSNRGGSNNGRNLVLKSKRTGKSYFSDDYCGTDVLLQSLADTGFNVIGYRVGSKSEIRQVLTNYRKQMTDKVYAKATDDLQKSECCMVENLRGYQQYYLLAMEPSWRRSSRYDTNGSLIDDDDGNFKFDVKAKGKNGPTKGQITRAFIAAKTGRLNNRAILLNFAKKIAGESH